MAMAAVIALSNLKFMKELSKNAKFAKLTGAKLGPHLFHVQLIQIYRFFQQKSLQKFQRHE